MAIFSALALGHSLFLASHFWSSPKRSPNRFFLALLLTALAIRIIKSVLVIVIPESPDIIPAVGLIGMTAIGPSLVLYLLSFKNPDFQISSKLSWHYAPALILIALIPLFNDQQMFIAYVLAVTHMLAYILYSVYHIISTNLVWKPIEKQWVRLLVLCISVIWLTFFAQLLIDAFVTYLLVTIVATVVLYGLSIWARKRGKLFSEPKRYLKGNDLDSLNKIALEIRALFEEEQFYTDSNITVKRISAQLNEPDYLVSQAINYYFKKSFPELLNEYRVEHAATLIHSTSYDNLSIEGIAYESGYNSISAFYRAFKSIKGVTPAQLKKTSLNNA